MAVTFFVTNTLISVPTAHAAEVASLNTFTIPAEFGRVTEIIPQSKNGSLLIHIQEAHANFDAQQNIKSILQYLSDHYGIKLVFLEGAGNKIKPELLNFFPKDAELQKDANLTLLKAGELTGAEVFMIDQSIATRNLQGATETISKKSLSAPEAYGVENAEAYAKDLEAFREVCKGRGVADKFLGRFYREWQKKASYELNKNLREFLAQYVAFGEEKLPLNDWLEILRKASRESLDLNLEDVRSQLEWPILVRYFRLKQLEGKIDDRKLEIEKKKFFAEFSALDGGSRTKGSEKQTSSRYASSLTQEVEAIFESAKKHDLPVYKTRFVFERLMDALPEDFSFDLYPNLRLQIQQMILLSELQNDSFRSEIKELAKRLVGALARTEKEKQLTEVFREYQMIQKLFHLELSREEYQQVKSRGITPGRLLRGTGEGERKIKVPSDLSSPLSVSPEIQKLYRIALDFYSGAIVREGHMMQRAREIMANRKQTQAVLITGGFHTEGLKERVLASGSSYINITPNISEVTKEDQRNYLRALLGTQAYLRGGSKGLDESEIGASLASDGAFIKTLPNGRRFLALRLTDIRRSVGAYLAEKFSKQRSRSQEYMEALDQSIQRVIQDAIGIPRASLQPVLSPRSEVREPVIFVGVQSAKLDSQNRIQLRAMFSKMVEKGAKIIGMPERKGKELRVYPFETWQKVVAANRPKDAAKARKYHDQIHRDAFIFKMDGQGRINLSEPIRRGFLDSSVGGFEFVGAGDSFLVKASSRSEVREFLQAFVPMFFAINALGALPFVMAIMENAKTSGERLKIIRNALITATFVAGVFLVIGDTLLRLLGLDAASFSIAGGIVLFLISIENILEKKDVQLDNDSTNMASALIGVPFIVGPAVITTILALKSVYGTGVTGTVTLLNILIAGGVFCCGASIQKFLGKNGIKTLSKVVSLLLAAMGVAMIIKGLTTTFPVLQRTSGQEKPVSVQTAPVEMEEMPRSETSEKQNKEDRGLVTSAFRKKMDKGSPIIHVPKKNGRDEVRIKWAPRSEVRDFSPLDMSGVIAKTSAEFFKINSVQGGSEKTVRDVSEKIMDGIIPLFAYALKAAKFLIPEAARVFGVPKTHVESARRALGLAPDVNYAFVLGSDLALRKGMIEMAKSILKESAFAILVKNDPAMVAKAEALIKQEGLGDRVFVITDVKLARAKISKPGAALRGLISSDELMLAEELKDELKNDLIVMNKGMQERFLNAAGQLFQSLADKIAAQFSLARSA
jgi:small neutral amino acid transporter SnatA (MarC family)/DNA-binding transcriptional regulator/RsmH inhibitor MraZ